MKRPSPSRITLRSLHSVTLGVLLSAFIALPALATDPATQKLFGRWTNSPGFYILGGPAGFNGQTPNALACTETWIVAGAAAATERTGFPGEGAVQVFNAATGAWVRKLLPPLPATADRRFGISCAVSGNTAAIGATGPTGTPGTVYVYNLTTGALLKTLAPGAGGAADDRFGYAVAISGDWVVVGAYADDSDRGSAYFCNLKTNAQVKVQAFDGAGGDKFGGSVAAEGNVALIGSSGVDGNRGAAYAYDLSTQTLIKKLQPAASAAGNGVGWCVALHQGKAVLGAPFVGINVGKIFVMDLLTGSEVALTGSDVASGDLLGRTVAVYQNMVLAGLPFQSGNRGALYVFDLNSSSTTEFQKLLPPDGGTGWFGLAAGWAGNTAVAAASGDSTQATLSGALYTMRPITRPMPLTKVTAKGDFAPGAADINFNAWTDAYLNLDGEIAFASSLTGFGSNASKDTGIWNTMAAANPLDLALKSRQVDGGVSILSVSKPLINQPSNTIFRAVLTGTGVTAFDNQAIYKDNGTTTSRILRTGGAPSALFGGGVALGFTQVVQNRQAGGSSRIATPFTLRTGVVSTTAANDTGLLWFDLTTGLGETVAPREGSAAGATGLTYGQFTGRLAYFDDRTLYATAVAGAAAFNQAIFQKNYNLGEALIAKKGDIPPAPGAAPFTAFLGESTDDSEIVIYRATLGAPATVANNEGLWRGSTAIATLLMRKGVDLAPALPGLKIAKFVQFWQAYEQTLALVQLSGPGVTASNDQALLLYQTTIGVVGQVLVLMREGESAPGCGGATVGVISRVEVESYWGEYAVLATLVGAPAGTDQALFRGFTRKALSSAAEQTLRRPVPVLRKGTLFNNQPGKIKSIFISNTNVTASGAGNTGLGRAFQEGGGASTPSAIALTIEFDNGVRQLMKGIP